LLIQAHAVQGDQPAKCLRSPALEDGVIPKGKRSLFFRAVKPLRNKAGMNQPPEQPDDQDDDQP